MMKLSKHNLIMKIFSWMFDSTLSPKKRLMRLILSVALLFSILRLGGFIIKFGQESLQADFTAFYTAAQSLEAGKSPYTNLLSENPDLWDGVATFKHSRFLYPPLVATLFRALAVFPYSTAKYIWMCITVILMTLGIWKIAALFKGKISTEYFLFTAILATWYHPILTLLERGQIDGITFTAITAAIVLIITKRKERLAGVLLSIAFLFKLHTVFLIPFLLLRKKWGVLQGVVLGGSILLAATFFLHGTVGIQNYLSVQLPRISTYGESGTEEMKLDQSILKQSPLNAEQNSTIKDGKTYHIYAFPFVPSATLTRPIGMFLNTKGVNISLSTLSLLFLILAFLPFLTKKMNTPDPLDQEKELAYWQLVLTVLLLISPLTWVMNTLWIFPTLFLLGRKFEQLKDTKNILWLCTGTLGFFLIAMPDHLTFTTLLPYGQTILNAKYIIGELLLLGFLFSYFHKKNISQEKL